MNGAIYIALVDFIYRTGRLYDFESCATYTMKPEHSIDIDTPFDLQLAEGYVALTQSVAEKKHA